jgi:hypothetical protein
VSQIKPYPSIKELVLDIVRRHKGLIDFDAVTSEVKKHFPTSKWDKSHWAWYRNQIANGRFKPQFSEEILRNLCTTTKQPENGVADVRVKEVGDTILNQARTQMDSACGEDQDFRFKVNRWVYSRLQLDERKIKTPIKKSLWRSGVRACQQCGKSFDSIKGVELHRKNSRLDYSVNNCVLLCDPCHQMLHG